MPAKGLLGDRQHSLVELAHQEIERRIYAGELEYGQKLVIDSLAKEFGTSLIPVREALARLNAERLVKFEPNRGYRVSPPPDAAELSQLFSARLILEIGALELSISHFNAAGIAELKDLNSQMQHCSVGPVFESFNQFVQLNSKFHETIIKTSGNRFIIESFRSLAYRQRISQTLEGRGIPDMDSLVKEHAQIIMTLEAHNLKASQAALRRHIIDGANRMNIEIGATVPSR